MNQIPQNYNLIVPKPDLSGQSSNKAKEAAEQKERLAREARAAHDADLDKKGAEKARARTRRQLAAAVKNEKAKTHASSARVAAALGLNKAQANALRKGLSCPALAQKNAEKLFNAVPDLDIDEALNSGNNRELLSNLLSAMGSDDPLKTLGLDPQALNAVTEQLEMSSNKTGDIGAAIGKAQGMIALLIGKDAEATNAISETAQLLEQLKAEVATNLSNSLDKQLAHYNHEMHRMHRLRLLKKILGPLIAAILALISLVTADPGLFVVAMVMVAVAAKPDLMSTISDKLAESFNIKGKNAGIFALCIRIAMAVMLALASGGCSATLSFTGIASTLGTLAGTSMMAGVADGAATLNADLKYNCDAYELTKKQDKDLTQAQIDKKQAVQDNMSKTEMIVSIVLAAVAIVGLGANFFGGASGGASAKASETAEATAARDAEATPTAEAGETGVVEDADEVVEDELNAERAAETSKAKRALLMKKLVAVLQGGLAGSMIAQGSGNIAEGVVSLNLSTTMLNLAKINSDMQMTSDSSHITQREEGKDLKSHESTTAQAVEELQTMTLELNEAFRHQIVGAMPA